MKLGWRPTILGAMGTTVACLLAAAIANGQAGGQARPQAPSEERELRAEDVYKNIQVMKGLPADLMVPSMQFMEIALGVHCVYCHDADAAKRDLDTKPTKNVARAMIRMVNDINKNTFNGKDVVTCYTCHRGSTNPVVVLPYNDEPAHSTAAVRATMPTVDQLLDRYTTAPSCR